jgi:KTSC domain
MAGSLRKLEQIAAAGVAADVPYGDAMPSTAIRDIAYDPARRALTVTFVTGRRYVYADVAPDRYVAFQSAPSKGAFFNLEIRDAYAYRELERLRR